MAETAAPEGAAVANGTLALLPSPKDLFLAIPRAASKASSFFSDIFEVFENLFGNEIREQSVAAATGGAGGLGPAAMAAAEAEAGGAMSYLRAFNVQQLRTFTGIFGYLTSRWALCCFAVAIILNRTQVYSATRRQLRPRWEIRLLIRSIAILPLLLQIQNVLRGIHCQTSPNFSLMRYGTADKLTTIDFSQDGGFLHQFSSYVLLGESDLQSCQAVDMVSDEKEEMRPHGSLSLIWPSFKTLCFSKFVETLSCAVAGSPAATETGMSLFEHSLAFAETESMVGNLIGLGPLSSPRNGSEKLLSAVTGTNVTSQTAALSRSTILSRFNTSPEVLLITLISLCNSASSHVLAIFDKQAQYRLFNTGVWGIAFLASFLWAFNSLAIEQILDTGIFRFPTVCVVGFIPHLLIVFGIVLCAMIYLIALILSAISPPPGAHQPETWRDRFRAGYENMQANAQLAHIRINTREDFYTALLRLGLSTLTAASEAVFLNEGRHINLGQMTWLEEERLNELDQARRAGVRPGTFFVTDATDQVASGVAFSDSGSSALVRSDKWQSGYSKERTTKLLKNHNHAKNSGEGVGTMQRSSRYMLAFTFHGKIFWLVVGWHLLALDKALKALHIRYRPGWMTHALQSSSPAAAPSNDVRNRKTDNRLNFWILSDDGELTIPKDDDYDIESEVRKRMKRSAPEQDSQQREKDLDTRLYNWFTSDGWWGERDESGDFVPNAIEDDATSVVSTATDVSDAWSADDGNDDGRQTPTQSNFGRGSPESKPVDQLYNAQDLARLLDPRDPETRREARILARHLGSEGIVTRSQFNNMQGDPSIRVLTSSRDRPVSLASKSTAVALSSTEEAEVLEHLIIKFRKEKGLMRRNESQDDVYSGGPQCVVCQTAPRTIMAWPCRCLSLCEDCRVSLAMNNFGNCVCCRQEVVGFSRLFVP